ncbi:cytochrome P450 [Rhizopogon vinicolor AM-OR11-026]|uniref:Cytochrome P450 n=1 Tax=Rhizopogon vinicolor AM-OR11-026 TaxID=1314800 RepID=A0A1B7MSI8_9AGAM|nr:cytochrome P450 [Rhizopogon vinicolor AM-OR11-026]
MIPSVDSTFLVGAVLPISLVIITIARRFIVSRQHGPLPPGPVPLPLLGNILSIDTGEPWLTYTKWRATYGDLIYVQILDQGMIVINSPQVAENLLEKRSRIYSDRPYLATMEPYGWSFSFGFLGYNDEWRLRRRLFHQTFRSESALKFRPIQIRQARQLSANIIDDPEHYHSHFSTFTTSTMMSAVYGYESSARDDSLVQLVENAVHLGISVLTPERAAMVKAFPLLLKIPDWCWGSSIKREAQASTDRFKDMRDLPFQYVQKHMADSSFPGQSSMVAENLRRIEEQDSDETLKPMLQAAVKDTAAAAIAAAYESSTSTLMVFVLAMVLYPDVQTRAQAEIDTLIGRDRLPTFDDRESLPYVDALVRETLRWNPTAPLGFPRATSSDDTYDGYFIPKGTTVMTNMWAITQDETRYPDASRFMPERFIDSDGALTDDDPKQYIFGRGRRICPGRYSADFSLWSAIVTMLATVDISYAKDGQGKAISFTPKFTTGFSHTPLIFPCSILPRSHFHSEHLHVD